MSKHINTLTLPLALFAGAALAAQPTAPETEAEPPATEASLEQLRQRGEVVRDENTSLQQRIAGLEQKNAELGSRRAAQEAQLAEVLERLAKLEAARDD